MKENATLQSMDAALTELHLQLDRTTQDAIDSEVGGVT